MNVELNVAEFRNALEQNASTYGVALTVENLDGLANYYRLLMAWNSRLHLVAPASPGELATRHVLESLTLLSHLPSGASVADIGSGGGLPIIPCLIVRPDLRAVLIEASPKKTIFLREVLREVVVPEPASSEAVRARVVAERFENVSPPTVDFVTCRALERFEETIPSLLDWAPQDASLLLFGGSGLGRSIAASGFAARSVLLPDSEQRFLYVIASRQPA